MRTANPNIEIFSSIEAARRAYSNMLVGSLLSYRSDFYTDKRPAEHPLSAKTAWPDLYQVLASKTGPRSISIIAAEIRADWDHISPAAAPYLEAMDTLDKMDDEYGSETADGIVLYFLSNAQGWRGEVAKRIKAELKAMGGHK